MRIALHRLHEPGKGVTMPRMERVGTFPVKLGIAMRALSLSRVAMAHELAVDKSLIGRWISGGVHPTEHNLARITALVAARRQEFRLADWFLSPAQFAQRFGLPEPALEAVTTDFGSALFGAFLTRTREEAGRRDAAYEGFWRTTRPSLLMTDRLFHDYGMIRRSDNGLLEVRMRGAGLGFSGWVMPSQGNLFVILQDPVGMTPMSLVFRGVALPRAMVLEGLLLLAGLDATRTPGVLPILLERIGDLSGDQVRDDEHCETLSELEPQPLEPLDPEVVAARIFRDSGPLAAAQGGAMFLSVGAQDGLSCGTTGEGLAG